MCTIVVDAVILVILFKVVNDDEMDALTAILFAAGAAIGTNLLAFGGNELMGIAGVFLAAFVAAILVGIAVSAFFGAELKRSLLIGALFLVAHVGTAIVFDLMF